ncbi:Unknown protein [Striga hermonthica]|uniref:Uncharacterized protein n=1 Tax=Striga hermonthica TaxID=68872 RepID=A0A9N7N8I1_STRHE|nr:Unknown protein [Striga hermonthica]
MIYVQRTQLVSCCLNCETLVLEGLSDCRLEMVVSVGCQQAIEEKVRALVEKLNPIPFIPNKIPDFAKHERLLANLGLWDFVHIDLDRNIRVDLIAELIATYEPKIRASYVDGYRISVSRADLARAFKLPVKKKGTAAGGFDVDLENEPLSDESIGFVSELVSDWLLLHEEDTWMMPNEVTDWFKLIRDGHPEKVDWASMFWFMVEKELKQGSQLRDCHYASHLQHLIKCQREHLFSAVKPDSENDKEEDHGVIKEGVDVDVNVVGEKTNNLEEKDFPVEGPSTVLSLGQDGEKEEVVKDVEMVDENCKDRDGDDEVAEDGDEQGQWLFNGTNEFGKHFMRRCAAKHNEEFGRFDEKKEEEEEEEEVQIEEDEVPEEEEEDGDENENKFGLSPSHHDSLNKEGYTGNYLQSMEVNQMAFNPQDQLGRQSSMDDMSLFNNMGKRVLEQNETHLMDNPNEPNKKLRISNSWDHNNKHMDFGAIESGRLNNIVQLHLPPIALRQRPPDIACTHTHKHPPPWELSLKKRKTKITSSSLVVPLASGPSMASAETSANQAKASCSGDSQGRQGGAPARNAA